MANLIFRSFVKSWMSLMHMHETIGDHRLQWAKGLNEMSQELGKISVDCEQERKSVRQSLMGVSDSLH